MRAGPGKDALRQFGRQIVQDGQPRLDQGMAFGVHGAIGVTLVLGHALQDRVKGLVQFGDGVGLVVCGGFQSGVIGDRGLGHGAVLAGCGMAACALKTGGATGRFRQIIVSVARRTARQLAMSRRNRALKRAISRGSGAPPV